jgi:hypothetical protein
MFLALHHKPIREFILYQTGSLLMWQYRNQSLLGCFLVLGTSGPAFDIPSATKSSAALIVVNLDADALR